MTETTPKTPAAAGQPATPADAGPAATWTQLSVFKVTYLEREGAEARVYRNGRQQVPIKIVIKAHKDNGEEVEIPSSDLTKLTLINYNNGAALPSGYALQRARNTKYDYFPESLPQQAGGDAPGGAEEAEPALSESDREWQAHMRHLEDSSALQVEQRTFVTADGVEILSQEVHLWITTTSAEASVRLAARITAPTGVFIDTRGPANGPGKFDSSVTIKPQPPHVYAHGNFRIDRIDAVTNSNFDVDLYYVSFNDLNLKIRDSIHYTTGGDIWHYSWKKDGSNKVQVAYRADARRTIRFKSFCNDAYYCDFTINDRPGQATAARIIDRPHRCVGGSYDWGRMGYIDNFGTESKLTLAPSGNGNTMSLVSYGAKSTPPDPE